VHSFLLFTIRQKQGKLIISEGKQHLMVRNRILSWRNRLW